MLKLEICTFTQPLHLQGPGNCCSTLSFYGRNIFFQVNFFHYSYTILSSCDGKNINVNHCFGFCKEIRVLQCSPSQYRAFCSLIIQYNLPIKKVMSEKSTDHLKQSSKSFKREGGKCKDTYLFSYHIFDCNIWRFLQMHLKSGICQYLPLEADCLVLDCHFYCASKGIGRQAETRQYKNNKVPQRNLLFCPNNQ